MQAETRMNWFAMNIIYIFFGIIMLLSCDRSECPRYMQIPASFVPPRADFYVGDTITIVSKFHRKQVLAFDSEESGIGYIDASGFNWRPATVIFRTDTLGQAGVTTVHKYFKFIDNPEYDYSLRVASEDLSIYEGNYNYNEDTFDLSFKFIANKAGTYFLRQGCASGKVEDLDLSGKCPDMNIVDVWVDMNSSQTYPANNIELLAESPDPHYNTGILANPKSQFYQFGGYCFRVVP